MWKNLTGRVDFSVGGSCWVALNGTFDDFDGIDCGYRAVVLYVRAIVHIHCIGIELSL